MGHIRRAPLLLKVQASAPVTSAQALAALDSFLTNDAPTVLGASATTRAALARLVEGLATEMAATKKLACTVAAEEGGDAAAKEKKKKRKGDKDEVASEAKKRRKLEAKSV